MSAAIQAAIGAAASVPAAGVALIPDGLTAFAARAAAPRAGHQRPAGPSCGWRLRLAPGGGLAWAARDGGRPVAMHREPDTARRIRHRAHLPHWLPIKSRL